jgi:predicted Zn-dependent peptidase
MGGVINAYTSHHNTVYYVSVPKSRWKEGLEVLVELAGQPLNRPEDVEAERKIIEQEMKQGRSEQMDVFWEEKHARLWGAHPLAQSIIGTEESLASMDVSTIQRLHEISYGRNRCSLFVSGNVTPEELIPTTTELFERIPDRPVSPRRIPGDYGPLPAWQSQEDRWQSTFESTVVQLLFPLPTPTSLQQARRVQGCLNGLFNTGGLHAPLYRTVREERQLVYSTGVSHKLTKQGGYIGFSAHTSKEKVGEVLQAFWDVTALPELSSPALWDSFIEESQNDKLMEVINPARRSSRMLSMLMHREEVIDFDAGFDEFIQTPMKDVHDLLNVFSKDKARVLVMEGTA